MRTFRSAVLVLLPAFAVVSCSSNDARSTTTTTTTATTARPLQGAAAQAAYERLAAARHVPRRSADPTVLDAAALEECAWGDAEVRNLLSSLGRGPAAVSSITEHVSLIDAYCPWDRVRFTVLTREAARLGVGPELDIEQLPS